MKHKACNRKNETEKRALHIVFASLNQWAQLGGGHGGRVPPTFSDSGAIIYHIPHIFLFRSRNILVSHQTAPLTFYNKIALMFASHHTLHLYSQKQPHKRNASGQPHKPLTKHSQSIFGQYYRKWIGLVYTMKTLDRTRITKIYDPFNTTATLQYTTATLQTRVAYHVTAKAQSNSTRAKK